MNSNNFEEKKEVEVEAIETEVKQEKIVEEGFEEQLEESLANIPQFSIGDKITGEIIDITDSYIFVSIGGKRDAYAEKTDYIEKDGKLNMKTGDVLTGYIVKHTDSEIIIAKSIASANRKILRDAFEEKIPVVGVVTSPVKGGFSISISGIRAFCPASQIDSKIAKDSKVFAGKSFDFLITELSENNQNIIVSRRKLLAQENAEKKQKLMEGLKIDSVVKGRVSRLTNFGAFVDLGGIDGLLHISEMSWAHIDSPSDVISIDDEIDVKIIKMNKDKLSLSMKALTADPFDAFVAEAKEGDVVTCKVLRNLKFGSFVEIKDGIEALIPISEMALGRHINHPREVINVGDTAEAQIMKINIATKKISLSLKALQPNPWEKINSFIEEGDIINGIVENITEFGTFVRLKDGITGLLPKSKMKFLEEPLTKESINSEFKVRITQIDTEKKRISLEPSEMPESAPEGKTDWKRYKKQKNKKEVYDPDNPFLNL
ncbi:MAG: S1 RNA-binding domain-containing protein [Candidatus Cloacimonetes bacterium]|nr:S1 RNA-binding domain-containing protein [Candidatus Cloacimonadota bacterium]